MNTRHLRCLVSLALAALSHATAHAAVTHYEVTATLSADEGQLEGSAVVRWTNRTPRALEALPLSFSNKNAMGRVGDLRVDGESAEIRDRDEDGFRLVLPSPLAAGATSTIRLSFTSDRRERHSQMPYTSFEDAWFPLLPAIRDGELDAEREELADFEVELVYPSRLQLAASGRELSQTEEGGLVTLKTAARGVSGYGIAYGEGFRVKEAESAGVRIRSFFQADDAKWGERLLEYAVDIVDYYRSEIGFYPQPKLDIFPGYSQPWGGYPVTPNVVTIHRGLDRRGDQAASFASWIMAHEIAHQYWGFGTVLDDARYTRWFGLSMGIFTDRLYSRAKGHSSRWHDDFRWRYLGGVLAGVDTTVLQEIEQVERIEWDWNNIVAHGKSFAVLEMLEYVVGDAVFLEIFRTTLERHRGQVVTVEIFQELCEEISGRELGWFFHQWYRTNAVLDYRVGDTKAWREGGENVVEVTVLRRGEATMPLDVALVTEEGETLRRRIGGWPTHSVVTFRTPSTPREVVLDPDRRLALLSRALRTYEPIEMAARTLLRLERSEEAVALLEDSEGLGREESYYWYLLGVARTQAGDFPGAEEALLRVESFEDRPGGERDAARALLRLGQLRDLQGRRDDAIAIYTRCQQLEDTREACGEYLESAYERR